MDGEGGAEVEERRRRGSIAGFRKLRRVKLLTNQGQGSNISPESLLNDHHHSRIAYFAQAFSRERSVWG